VDRRELIPTEGVRMEERDQTQDEVILPDQSVEDLEPDAAESDDVAGGYVKKHIGNVKYEDIT
jgi:hypothetical protein